jgi:CBS domain-containing protein
VSSSEQSRVADIMTYRPVTLGTDTTLADAMAIVERELIEIVPVTREGALVGVLSRQALREAVGSRARDRDSGRSVTAIMTSATACVSPDTSLSSALAVMTANRCDWLPVTIGALLIGIITRAALVHAR